MKYLIILFSWMMLGSFKTPSPGKGLWTVTIDTSGRYAVTGGDDRMIRLYQTKDMKLMKTFPVVSMIRRLAWQPYGHLLAVATNDKHMHLRNMVTGDSIPLQGAEFGGRGITWSYNGKFLAATDNYLIKIFNEKGQWIRTIPKVDNNTYLDIDWHPSKIFCW
ncbi:MAG: WD40 repeat domain-containing protein [Bacteroidota bacterium]